MRCADSKGIGLLEVSDVTGQKGMTVSGVPADASVGELVEQLLEEMRLSRADVSGRPLTYHARLEREGRHLLSSERVGDALQTGDRLVLQPNIDAGGPWPGAAPRFTPGAGRGFGRACRPGHGS